MEFYEEVAELAQQGHPELVDILLNKLEEYHKALRIIGGEDQEYHNQVVQNGENPYWAMRNFALMYLEEEEEMISGDVLETLIELKSWLNETTTFQVSMAEEGGGALIASSRFLKYTIRFENENQVSITTELHGNEVDSLSKSVGSDLSDIRTVLKNIFNSTQSILKNELQYLP